MTDLIQDEDLILLTKEWRLAGRVVKALTAAHQSSVFFKAEDMGEYRSVYSVDPHLQGPPNHLFPQGRIVNHYLRNSVGWKKEL